ncbi:MULTISPECIES: hypothetical protein [unclassified Clostridioides]|nr:hypothetical protein [Clostridioides sp. ES-W-0018-02]MCC0705139.1 hypothetical protein [Clostridioides sp. ES-S-0049-02]MCC0713040.1 hypothetical protein [Clostridioides sp. ES-W-0017-02]
MSEEKINKEKLIKLGKMLSELKRTNKDKFINYKSKVEKYGNKKRGA